MWKTNLLELFPATADRGQHPKRSKQQTILLECWLSFMYALSFHTDGQLNILKLRDIFDVLVELFKSKTNAQLTLNIIRNLCFHSPSKNRISSNDSVVDVLLSNLDNKQTRMDSSIALLTLLCNNQKAKVHLKGAGLGKRVQHSLDKLSLEGWEGEKKYKRCLEDVLVIMTG
uniref:Uncharacterized protein n=1 Tax=Ciona intestinalis TaxID=7719 RepID=F6QLD7_CIOIN